jgi:hypothetical protein
VVFLGDGLGDLGKEGNIFGVFSSCGMGSLLCQYYDVEKVAMIYKKI